MYHNVSSGFHQKLPEILETLKLWVSTVSTFELKQNQNCSYTKRQIQLLLEHLTQISNLFQYT